MFSEGFFPRVIKGRDCVVKSSLVLGNRVRNIISKHQKNLKQIPRSGCSLESSTHNTGFGRETMDLTLVVTFDDLGKKKKLKTLLEKEKRLITSIFSFSKNVFYPSPVKFQFFSHVYFVLCKFFQFEQIQNFAVWQRFNTITPAYLELWL